MKITYIGHSSFMVETEKSILLFDYYEGTIPRISSGKQLVFFASHRHGDHFNPEIFSVKADQPVVYVLSFDIRGHEQIPANQENIIFAEAEKVYAVGDLRIQTLRSTDEGVAFLVETEGKRIYHAGDLNDWQWEEEGEEWNERIRRDYRTFLEPLRNLKIDVGFMLLDPRQEKQYGDGMRYYLELTDTQKVFPMHFWRDYSVIDRWLDEYPESAGTVQRITKPGEIFLFEEE